MRAIAKVYRKNRNCYAIETDTLNIKVGERLQIFWGHNRSLEQNKLYWKWLQWVIDNGLRYDGCLEAEELHETLKQCLGKPTTTDLCKKEFKQFFEDAVDLVAREYQISSNLFFELYGG